MAKPGTHLHRIQNSPHHIKMRWLWILSAVAFAIVLLVWLMAFPAMVAMAPPATENNPNPSANLSGFAALLHSLNKKQ